MSLFTWLGKSASMKKLNTYTQSLSLHLVHPFGQGQFRLTSRFIFRLLRGICDWSVPPSPLSIPPPVIVCKSGRDWASRWGWGWWLLSRWRTQRPERQPRGEIAAPSELSTAPWCWTPSPSVRSWCTLTIFWDGINGFHSLPAANFSRGHLSVPTSHRKLRESRIWPEIILTNSLLRSVAPPFTVILVWIIFLDGWLLDTKVISGTTFRCVRFVRVFVDYLSIREKSSSLVV